MPGGHHRPQRRRAGEEPQLGVERRAHHQAGVEGLAGCRERQHQRGPPGIGTAQPHPARGDLVLGAVPHPEHLPAVADRRGVLGGGREADPGPHGGSQRRGQRVAPPIARGDQAQQGQLLQQAAGPAFAGDRDGGQPAHHTGQGRGLGVDQARGHRVPVPVPRVFDPGQAVADLVGQPPVQLVEAGGDPGPALGGAAGGTGGGLLRVGRAGLAADLAGGAGRVPLGHPVRRLVGLGHAAGGPQQQQAQRVLAGELPARAGAAVRRGGQVHAGLVRLLAAAPAQSPQARRVAVGAAGTGPRGGRREAPGGLGGRGIGGEREHLVGAPPFGHVQNAIGWVRQLHCGPSTPDRATSGV